MNHTVCLISGDGIGPEVTNATRQVIDATGVDIEWVLLPAGATALDFCGSVLPARTIAAIEGHGVALKGPTTTPISTGHASVNVELRKRLNLFAAVRPIRSLPAIKTRYNNVDLVVIRENTEGLYSGLENEIVKGVIQSLKIATAKACTRIGRFACDYAIAHDRKKITVLHKANILKMSDGLFLKCIRKVHKEYADKVAYEELLIDSACMQLVSDPLRYGVLVCENLYGDMISNMAAGFVGGLGVVPGANLGQSCAVFEPVHGSALDIARKGIANPLACIMSGVMLLDYLDLTDAAKRIREAYELVLAEANPEHLTPDIGGKGTTQSFTDAIIQALK